MDDHWQFLCVVFYHLYSVFGCPLYFICRFLKMTILFRSRWIHLKTELPQHMSIILKPISYWLFFGLAFINMFLV